MTSVETSAVDASGYVLFATGPRFVVIRKLVDGEPVTIGRSRSADVCLADPLVSRKHIVVSTDRFRSGRLCVRDLGSRNGTSLGGRQLEPDVDVELVPGQAIRVGSTMLVVE